MIILARGNRKVVANCEIQAIAFEHSGFVRISPDETADRQGMTVDTVVVNSAQDEPVAEPPVAEPAEKPKRRRRKKTDAAEG